MAEIFRDYEKELIKFLTSANKKIALLNSQGANKPLINQAQQDLQQSDSFIRMMENQLQVMDPTQSNQFRPRFNRHKQTLNNLKQGLRSVETQRNKQELLGQGSNPRSKLLTNNEVIQDSGDSLERALKYGLESEQIGHDTMNNLKTQRKQIHNINDKVNDVGTNLNQANRVISSMDRRRIWMKVIMMGIILLLLAAICLILYLKLGQQMVKDKKYNKKSIL